MMPFCSSSGGGLHIKRKALVLIAVASKFCGDELGAAYQESITTNYYKVLQLKLELTILLCLHSIPFRVRA